MKKHRHKWDYRINGGMRDPNAVERVCIICEKMEDVPYKIDCAK